MYKRNKILVWEMNSEERDDDGIKVYTPLLRKIQSMPKPNYMREGWGIAYRNRVLFDESSNEVLESQQLLYTTDSSDKISVIDPDGWKTLGQISVTEDGSPLTYLNELEIIERDVDSLHPYERMRQHKRSQWVFANRFGDNVIYMVSLETGKVAKKWDLTDLVNQQKDYISETGEEGYDWGNNVLNGIAYKKETDTFLLTGKMWDFLFEVHLDYHSAMDL